MTESSLQATLGADGVTQRVREMYSRYPYPSANSGERRLTELANLLRLYSVETKDDLRGKRILDVGTGTGHRLIMAAHHFPDTSFTGVDLAEPPLEIARETAAAAGIRNVEFRQADLLGGAVASGRYDVVLCMGVLHHLADPALGVRQLARHVADDGVLFMYVYGATGSAERMRRKEVLTLLMGGGGDLDAGIRLAKSLGYATDAFGWNRNADDPRSVDSLIVDSYLNVHERLFDVADIARLMQSSELDAFLVFGITGETRGFVFDTALEGGGAPGAPWTDMRKILPTEDARAAYERLGLRERYRLVELAWQPNGYTIMAYRGAASSRLEAAERIRRNALTIG